MAALAAPWKSLAISWVVYQCLQFACGEWTFSLRMDSVSCRQTAEGPPVSCDELFMGVCLRHPGTSREDGHTCFLFIATSNATSLQGRQLTSADEVNGKLMPIGRPHVKSSISYKGGIQLYVAVLNNAQSEFPPYNETNTLDKVFVELTRVPGLGECNTEEMEGVRGRVRLRVSFTVDCYAGFSGDNCSCTGNTTCATSSMTCGDPTLDTSPTPTVTNPSTPTVTNPSPLNATETSDNSSLVVPLLAGAGGFVLLLLVLIALVVICLVYRHRRYKKSYRLDLSHLAVGPITYPPTIPPNDVVDDGITYTAVVHDETQSTNGYHGTEYNEEEKTDLSSSVSQPSNELTYIDVDHNQHSPPPTKKGLQYVTVEHDQPTYTTFKKGNGRHKPHPAVGQVQYVTVQREQSHRYANVEGPPRPKPRKKVPRGEQNIYSSVPSTFQTDPDSQ